MNLRAIRPNTQKLVDISVPLPSHSSSDSWASITSDDYTEDREVNFFELHASLALIQAEAFEKLLSVEARQRLATFTASAFKSIISKLDIWRRTNPLADADAPSMLNSMYRSDVVHSIILEASYFGTLYQLHAANALRAFARRLDVFSPNGLRSAAGLISFDVFADAQRLLEFAALIPQGNVSVTWVTMHAIIVALCMVLACNIPGNGILGMMPHPPNLAANMRLYKDTLAALDLATVQANNTDLTSKINVCHHLHAQVKEDDYLDQG